MPTAALQKLYFQDRFTAPGCERAFISTYQELGHSPTER